MHGPVNVKHRGKNRQVGGAELFHAFEKKKIRNVTINPLAPELFILILAHPVYKM